MEHNLTKEDIMVFAGMLIAVYLVMSFFQKKLEVYLKDQMDLFKWGEQLPLSDNQYKCLMQLWICYKTRKQFDIKIEEILTQEEFRQVKEYCSFEILPEKYKKSSKTRKKKEEDLIRKGFGPEYAGIIGGLIYNKVGGIHSVKIKSSDVFFKML